jgi:hypothetical protein
LQRLAAVNWVRQPETPISPLLYLLTDAEYCLYNVRC